MNALLKSHGINAEDLEKVIKHGLEVEVMNLEISKSLGNIDELYSIECRILQAQTFMSMLRSASLQS